MPTGRYNEADGPLDAACHGLRCLNLPGKNRPALRSNHEPSLLDCRPIRYPIDSVGIRIRSRHACRALRPAFHAVLLHPGRGRAHLCPVLGDVAPGGDSVCRSRCGQTGADDARRHSRHARHSRRSRSHHLSKSRGIQGTEEHPGGQHGGHRRQRGFPQPAAHDPLYPF